jgi:predicted amidohydrolase
VLVDMGVCQGLEIVELDLALVDETRQKLPLLKNRRSDVYQTHFRS